MGVRTVFTDHSLFEFADLPSIHLNKVLKWALSEVDAAIAVSHTNKENLALRARIDPSKIYVIPNAVDTTKFTPDLSLKENNGKINIVVVCRMNFRKGVDLLVDIIPEVIRKYPNVNFIIGGDGPKLDLLKQLRDKYNLGDRMELLGRVEHKHVRNVFCRGDIFLNTSLTEAFCIAILEAASCGLLCVSTNVGGICELLPDQMIYLAPPQPQKLIAQLERAIENYQSIDPFHYHETVKSLYSWRNVAYRVEKVYDDI